MLWRRFRTTFKKIRIWQKKNDLVLNGGLRKVAFRAPGRQEGFPGIHSVWNSPFSSGLGHWESVLICGEEMTTIIMKIVTVPLVLPGY